ncbi:MAG: energy transducer TonB [Mucilaginibacter sp.]|uniref:energy transducer TonB n=1 Tax=Mucilaginibacter sp. TaxID=1882438 RepID=UPI0034E47562
MENQPIARLNFTCNRKWEEMTPVAGGRFCNSCQKKVVDFTDKTNDEIAAYLMGSTTQVCGRFQQSQLVPAPPKPIWKRWLSAAAMFAAVFMGIKEASAQKVVQTDSVSNQQKNPGSFLGAIEMLPNFPGGEAAFAAYLHKNLRSPKGVKGRVTTAFVVEKDGSLTDIRILKGLNKEADEEAIRVLKESPKWKPGSQLGIVTRTAYTMPITFNNKQQ